MNNTLSVRSGFIKKPCGSMNGYMTCSLTVPHTQHKMIRNGVVVGSWPSLFHEQQSSEAQAQSA